MATTIRVPLNLSNPQVASNAGNSFFSVLGLTNYDAGHWEFLKDVDGKAFGYCAVPHNLAGTPNASIRLVTAYNATSGVSRWSVSTKDPADGETVNVSFTAETAQDITVPGTAYLRKDVSFTLTNPPAADDLLVVQIFHEGAHANDTVAVNSLLLAAFLQCDVN